MTLTFDALSSRSERYQRLLEDGLNWVEVLNKTA